MILIQSFTLREQNSNRLHFITEQKVIVNYSF